MQCPVDGTPLVMIERRGIEMDYCPQCRGVWLDRGEIDKIIKRSIPQQRGHQEADYDPRRKKRGSFLEDIFDF